MYEEEVYLELKRAYGADAEFREGQMDAIKEILLGKRTLVVQKTGWGKSLVYFLATKILRKTEKGFTLIVSPLLALMNNQIEAAKRLGLKVETINSGNKEIWEEIMGRLESSQVDALIISPERLANEEFKRKLTEKLAAQIGMLVVDEAHCISDWGHDFRPDYRRIVDIINKLPSNIPVLATTATANDRVVNDIKNQLGETLLIHRGSLMRESLAIEVIQLKTKEERLTWLADNIKQLPGTGIIYCLTVNDCNLVDKWLKKNGILSERYYSEVGDAEEKKRIISLFMENKIKILAATVAFGMGFDKPDIGFVIHFQKPKNLIEYYQQIGRAGRGIDRAYAILLCGEEDDEINNYFIDSAFPTEELMEDVIDTVKRYSGLKSADFERYINGKPSRIKNCIKYLLVNGDIYEEEKRYYKTPRPWIPDTERCRKITEIRKNELQEINDFTEMPECYMQFIAEILDDKGAKPCGKCSNCLKHSVLPFDMSLKNIVYAQKFLKEDFNVIEPRKKWPEGVRIDDKNMISEDRRCETGIVLSNYGDAGWGRLVSKGKYKDNCFSEELIEASYELLKDFVRKHDIRWVTNIPSNRRPELVKMFAVKLSEKLLLPYIDAIEKIQDARCQKELNTSYLQFKNASESFAIKGKIPSDNVLLIDDMFHPQIGVKISSMAGGGSSRNIWSFVLEPPGGAGQAVKGQFLTCSTSGIGLRLK